jgi:hypothetical protein
MRPTKPTKKNSKRWFIPLAAALWVWVAVSAAAADIKVIANPSLKASALSSEELRGVFLVTKTSLSDGSHVEPVMLKEGAIQATFVKQFIGKTETALEIYYRSLVFTGKGLLPKTFASDAEMINYVAKTKGAIGYVGGEASVDAVKTLKVK